MEASEVWSSVEADLQLSISAAYFKSYIKRLSLLEIKKVGVDKQEVVLACPSIFIQREVERRFQDQIKASFDRVTNRSNLLKIEVNSKEEGVEAKQKEEEWSLFGFGGGQQNTIDLVFRRVGLKPELSLDTFAVSSSNEMAYAAAKAVSQTPGSAYNPLFLYGGVGVGKTHLMQGVGQEILKNSLEMKTIYCTGEEFTNEIIGAIRKKSTASFKNKYRSVSLLLIDDIQFIAGKATVQEEFFHTFNAILKEGGQVIMTSDKPPKEIDALEDRLRSRFEGGLTIDIGQPNFELRCAILMIKSKQMGIRMPLVAAQLVAERIEDTRALIGGLMKLSAASTARNVKITPELVAEVLSLEGQKKEEVKPEKVKPLDLIHQVADYFGVDVVEVRGAKRVKGLVLPRHVAMFLLHNDCRLSLIEVGSWFGGRDHTTIMHAVNKVASLINQDKNMERDVENIRKQVYSG